VPENKDASEEKHNVERFSDGKEQIEYIADLLLELTEMARTRRLYTLTGLLELAHREAALRSRD
jgi:hypothetical protein